MHQNQFPHHSRARDPSAEARDRADAAEHQRRVRLIEKMDAAAARLAEVQRRDTRYRPDRIAIEKAQHRFDFFAAAAARAGLIRPRKEATQ